MRRVVDVLVASVALMVASPVLFALGAAVRASLGSPVLFRQTRSGLYGREFTILKFRTMHPPAYEDQPDSERTPPIGSLLRATSLDELPELFNVLRGDMSLIGPRPTLPEQVARYSPRQRRRLDIRPGLTGWAQVNGRNLLSWPERIELDLWYLDHRSVWLDLRIVAKTVIKLLRVEGITGEGGVNPGFPAE